MAKVNPTYKVGSSDYDEMVSKILNLVSRGIQKRGVIKIYQALQGLLLDDNEVNHKDIKGIMNYIILSVVNEFQAYDVSLNKLKGSQRGECTLARSLIILLAKSNIQIKNESLASFLNRKRQWVHHVIKEYESMDSLHPTDSKFIKIFNRLDSKVALYVKSKRDSIN